MRTLRVVAAVLSLRRVEVTSRRLEGRLATPYRVHVEGVLARRQSGERGRHLHASRDVLQGSFPHFHAAGVLQIRPRGRRVGDRAEREPADRERADPGGAEPSRVDHSWLHQAPPLHAARALRATDSRRSCRARAI